MEIDPILERQVSLVCEKVEELLPSSTLDLICGYDETEKITISVPKGFTYLALYIGMLVDDPGSPVTAWGHHQEAFKRKYKGQRGVMRKVIERIVERVLAEEYRKFYTRSHDLLEVPECLRDDYEI